METFLLEIITPQRQAFSEEVDAVYASTDMGTIGVLAHHEPLFCSLTEGEVKIYSGKKEYLLAIGGGFMQITDKKVSILVSAAVHADEINEAEIKKAETEAKEAIKRKVTGDDLRAAQEVLRRSMIEFKVLRHKQRRSSGMPH
jgi:F-type H+-transporting ATPase subunit epsilon